MVSLGRPRSLNANFSNPLPFFKLSCAQNANVEASGGVCGVKWVTRGVYEGV